MLEPVCGEPALRALTRTGWVARLKPLNTGLKALYFLLQHTCIGGSGARDEQALVRSVETNTLVACWCISVAFLKKG